MKQVQWCVALAFAVGTGLAQAGSLSLDFSSAAGGIRDASGRGTGFTTRLPGTGGSLPANDSNLVLDTAAGQLRITSTTGDLNGQSGLGTLEYLGVQLSTLGLTSSTAQDFSVTARFLGMQTPDAVDQLGVFIGNGSTSAFRMGFLTFGWPGWGPLPFSVWTPGFFDDKLDLSTINLPGYAAQAFGNSADVELTLARVGGQFQLKFANLGTGFSRTYLAPDQPTSLNGASNLVAGVFIGSTNPSQHTARLDSFSVTVATVPEPSNFALVGAGLLAVAGIARRKRRG